jgi:hypothetical protein
MVAATRETLAILSQERRMQLLRVRNTFGDFFLRSALELTPPTIEALLAGEAIDDSLVRKVERWCEERLEEIAHDWKGRPIVTPASGESR